MHLCFEPATLSLDPIREGFVALASALTGRTVVPSLTRRRTVSDPNHRDLTYAAEYADSDVVFEESVEGGEGNPRDGYGYEVTLVLTVQRAGGAVRAALRSRGDAATPALFDVRIEGARATEFEALREAVRRVFGEAAERSGSPRMEHGAVARLLARPGRGVEPAQGSVARRDPPPSAAAESAELASWLAERTPAGDEQLRDAPAVLGVWLAARARPAASLSREEVEEGITRLCPFDQGRLVAAGVPGMPWFTHPAWPLLADASGPIVATPWWRAHVEAERLGPDLPETVSASLTGWRTPADWREVEGEPPGFALAGWACTLRRHARYPSREHRLPRVRVTLTAARLLPGDASRPSPGKKELHERVEWSWIPGPETGDSCLILRRELGKRKGLEPAALTWCVVGSEGFVAAANAALAGATPYRWHPCTAEDGFLPWVSTEGAWLAASRGQPIAAMVDATLAAAGAAMEDRAFAASRLCRCREQEGHCAHRSELLERNGHWRKVVQESAEGPVAQGARVMEAAWNAAFCAAGAHARADRVLAAAVRTDEELRRLTAMMPVS